MENKYYAPSIDEFYVGFEYETYNMSTGGLVIWDLGNNESTKISEPNNPLWFTTIFQKDDFQLYPLFTDIEERINQNRIRLKYLDKDDIEDLKFKYISRLTARTDKFQKGKYQLYFNKESYRVRIGFNVDTEVKYEQIFDGYIKNKSELSKILKQLNI